MHGITPKKLMYRTCACAIWGCRHFFTPCEHSHRILTIPEFTLNASLEQLPITIL